MTDEAIGDFRAATVLGVVRAVDDTGQAQTVDAETHKGFVRAGVEVLQAYGFASNPEDGAICLLLAIGGDPGHMVALPLAAPGTRFGGLAKGETVMYGPGGSRVALRAGGTVDIMAATVVNTHVPLAHFTGDVTIGGSLGVTGAITAGGSIHATGDISSGGTIDTTGDVRDGTGSMADLRGGLGALGTSLSGLSSAFATHTHTVIVTIGTVDTPFVTGAPEGV